MNVSTRTIEERLDAGHAPRVAALVKFYELSILLTDFSHLEGNSCTDETILMWRTLALSISDPIIAGVTANE